MRRSEQTDKLTDILLKKDWVIHLQNLKHFDLTGLKATEIGSLVYLTANEIEENSLPTVYLLLVDFQVIYAKLRGASFKVCHACSTIF